MRVQFRQLIDDVRAANGLIRSEPRKALLEDRADPRPVHGPRIEAVAGRETLVAIDAGVIERADGVCDGELRRVERRFELLAVSHGVSCLPSARDGVDCGKVRSPAFAWL